MRYDTKEAFQEVVERGEPVHPRPPEGDQSHVRDNDSAEGYDKYKETRDEEGGEEFVGCQRGDELAESHIEHLEEHEKHPDIA